LAAKNAAKNVLTSRFLFGLIWAMKTQLPPKVGRKQKPYRTSWNETIDGLSRRPDGRWRIIGTQTTYSEHDERKATQLIGRAIRTSSKAVGTQPPDGLFHALVCAGYQ
jgi:hypothetical protein